MYSGIMTYTFDNNFAGETFSYDLLITVNCLNISGLVAFLILKYCEFSTAVTTISEN